MHHHLIGLLVLFGTCTTVHSLTVPNDFAEERIFAGLAGVFDIQFAPDGRMFLSEWRRGYLRIATYDAQSDTWTLLPEPFHKFYTPDSPLHGEGMYDSDGNEARSKNHRRGTLRGFTLDPDFATNGYIYVTYMHEDERSGYRLSRVQASNEDPNRSTGAETILLRCPFWGGSGSPGAHNGGGIGIGADGRLYASFGDGGGGSENAQSLDFFAGKVVRLNRDGSIPSDNPFYNSTTGDLRAIYCLGLRNPVGMSRHPVSGNLYISSFQGSGKADTFRVAAGANYGHGNYAGIGTETEEWVNTKFGGLAGATDTVWYPAGGGWPAAFEGDCFAANWKGDGGILRITGGEDAPVRNTFAGGVEYTVGDSTIRSVAVAIGPDGHLYYTVREYDEYVDLRRIRHLEASSGSEMTIQVDDSQVAEGGSTTLRLQRNDALDTAIDVTLAIGGSAGASDYDSLPLSVPLAAGIAEATVPVSIVDDLVEEADETITVQIMAGTGYRIGNPNAIMMTIPANDQPLRAPDPISGLQAGLAYDFLHLADPTSVDDITGVTPTDSGSIANLDLGPADRTTDFGFRFVGYFLANDDGSYAFSLTSDDASRLRIGDQVVIDNTNTGSTGSSIGLQAGYHALAVDYVQNDGTSQLSWSVTPPGASEQAVPDNLLWHRPVTGDYGLADRPSIAAYLDGAFPTNANGTMPPTLTQTGAFTDLTTLTPHPGLIPFTVNAPLWSDHAVKRRWVAVPDGTTVGFDTTDPWDFPVGSVTVKHFDLPVDDDDPTDLQRLETRFIVKTGNDSWYGVTYVWRADGSEADLLAAGGTTAFYDVATSGGGMRQQRWDFPSRSDCLTCHNSNAGFSLGLKTRQLNGDFTYPDNGVTDNQLRSWNHVGLFDQHVSDTSLSILQRLVHLNDSEATLERRSRSMLDVNCTHCHQPGGPGHGDMDTRFSTPLPEQFIIDGPVQDGLGIEGARIVAPRDPHRSILFHRTGLRGDAEQMPPVGSNLVDEVAIAVLRDWIESMPGQPVFEPPSLDPAAGHFAAPVLVTASHDDGAAVLRYTTDNSIPDAADPVFPAAGLTLSADTTLRVNAWGSDHGTSVSTSASYTVGGNGPPQISNLLVDPDPLYGTQCELQAAVSDPENDDLSWQWSLSGPSGSSPTYDSQASTPTVTFDLAGTYTVTVTVSDGNGGQDTATTTVTVLQVASSMVIMP